MISFWAFTPPALAKDRGYNVLFCFLFLLTVWMVTRSLWLFEVLGNDSRMFKKNVDSEKSDAKLQKDCFFTSQEQACTRIAWLFVCLFNVTMPKWPNTQENGCSLPPCDHNQGQTLFQTRLDQEKATIGSAVFLHCWHWILLFLCRHFEEETISYSIHGVCDQDNQDNNDGDWW